MNRLLEPRRESDAQKPLDGVTATDDSRGSHSGLQTLLFGLGVAGLAYVAARRLRGDGATPSMDRVRETVDDVRSGEGFDIPIGETGGDDDESGPAHGTGTTKGAIGNEPMPGEDLSSGGRSDQSDDADAEREEAAETDAERELSDHEAEARTEEDVDKEPASPGEMTIGEDVAEDVTDDESDAADHDKESDATDHDEESDAADHDEESDAMDQDEEGDAMDQDEESDAMDQDEESDAMDQDEESDATDHDDESDAMDQDEADE